MKRYPKFAIVALLLLLLVLLGSWVYLEHYPWPADSGQTAKTDGSASGSADAGDPLDGVDSGEAQEDEGGTGKGGPLEPSGDPVKRDNPPDPIDTGGKKDDSTTAGGKTGDTIIAELTPNMAAVRDGNGNDDELEPLIVSTLRPARERIERTTNHAASSGMKDTGLLGSTKPIGQDKSLDEAFTRRFIGRLIWPELSDEDTEQLQKDFRRQAVVYFDKLPEFRAVVQADEGWFSLPMTTRMESDYRGKGLKLVVHSPAFEVSGGFEAVMVKKDEGEVDIKLQVTPVIQVTVDVSPPEAIESGVRVWLERQGLPGSPDHDDSLYISAKVPESGRLVFSVPEHYGELRVAATGQAWHSGLPQIVSLREWKTNKANVRLELAGERCDSVAGTVVNSYRETPLYGARLESTHYGTTVYTNAGGSFEMWVPLDPYAGNRQFLCTATNLRPEILPLENRATGTEGVEGIGPSGPFRVTLAATIVVELHLPREATKLAPYTIFEPWKEGWQNRTTKESKERRYDQVIIELPWGTQQLTVANVENEGKRVTVWIDEDYWQDSFKLYAARKEGKTEIEAVALEDRFKKR